MKLDLESKMDFDYSVSTEDRFALRNWLNQLVKEINYNDSGAYLPKLSETLHVEGFTDEPMEHDDFVAFLARRASDGHVRVMSYPELKVSARYNRFSLRGSYEEVTDGVLSSMGTIEIVIGKEDGEFKLWWQMFYPRLRVQDEEVPESQSSTQRETSTNETIAARQGVEESATNDESALAAETLIEDQLNIIDNDEAPIL